MWTHRRSLELKRIRKESLSAHPPLLSAAVATTANADLAGCSRHTDGSGETVNRSSRSSSTSSSASRVSGISNPLPEDFEQYICITALHYTIIADLAPEDVAAMSWMWSVPQPSQPLPFRIDREACRQVEYFFVGTNNGELMLLPLLPPGAIMGTNAADSSSLRKPPFARRIHQHTEGESVLAVDVVGGLVASGCMDRTVMISVFHPSPSAVVAIHQPSPIRSLLLWEGKPTCMAGAAPRSDAADNVWVCSSESELRREATAVYLFTGDEAGVVRLWRVDVLQRTYHLHSLFVMSNLTGWDSPACGVLREAGEASEKHITLHAGKSVHCLARDGDDRIIAGSEGMLVVWSLRRAPLKVTEEDHSLVACIGAEAHGAGEAGCDAKEQQALHVRVKRLLNGHVWLKSARCLRRELDEVAASGDRRALSRFKPKYERCVTSGKEVGVVVNGPEIHLNGVPAEFFVAATAQEAHLALLRRCTIQMDFPSLRNAVRFPLSCVEPVQHPYSWVSTGEAAVFAVQVLQKNKRLVTSGSDGSVRVWLWTDVTVGPEGRPGGRWSYVPLFASSSLSGGRGSGLGRHLCVLRSPDIFVSCGMDDGLVREWHIYDEPEPLMRCERRFALLDASTTEKAHGEVARTEGGSVTGVGCAIAFPLFYAIFLVGSFESTIQTFSLAEVQGCAPPPTHLYNGTKTVRLTEELLRQEGQMIGPNAATEEAVTAISARGGTA